jgi:hypothetical protein
VQRPYGTALRERAGAADVLESLEGGAVEGENRTLMWFLGSRSALQARIRSCRYRGVGGASHEPRASGSASGHVLI